MRLLLLLPVILSSNRILLLLLANLLLSSISILYYYYHYYYYHYAYANSLQLKKPDKVPFINDPNLKVEIVFKGLKFPTILTN